MSDPSAFRLASYNIRKAVGLDGRRAPGRIIDVINRLDADVIALQEVDKRLGERPAALDRRMIEEHTDLKVADIARNDVSLGWHGNAVLVKKGLTIHGVDHIALPGLEPRGAVQVDIGEGARQMAVIGTHLGLLRPYRRLQLSKIMAHLRDTDTRDAAILGDFNEWSQSKGLEALGDSFEVVSPGKSFHAARPLAGLDRVALSRRLKLSDAGVDESSLARVASDHLPIWSDVLWPDAK